jgi:hypothetical protein
MKRLLILSVVTLVAASSAGCASCGRPFLGWFNRGDSCRTCADGGCDSGHVVHDDGSPGLLGSPIYGGDVSAPRNMGILPGPVLNQPPVSGS